MQVVFTTALRICTSLQPGERMETKSTTVTFRIAPTVKKMLKVMADSECRSVSNLIEVMVRERFGSSKVRVPKKPLDAKRTD